jgi:heme oxygenase
MMSLKELTKEQHTAAEATPFMKAVFKKSMPMSVWKNFTFQKAQFYRMIEAKTRRFNLLGGLEGIERAELLDNDYFAMQGPGAVASKETTAYCQYLDSITDPEKMLAHLYVWHMGDMFGGQMIKKIVDAPSSALDFENPDELKANMYVKLKDTMADEANLAFEWAIKIMNEYADELAV